MQINDNNCRNSIGERKEKVEAALTKLKFMKFRVSELRAQCETLKRQQSEKKESLTCNECGKPIVQDQEVTLKDTFGEVMSYYHKDCFKAIWISQNWRFDYSSPGFLRMSGKDQ